MILEEKDITDLRPYDIRNFDGEAAEGPGALPEDGALQPVAPGAGFDPVHPPVVEGEPGAGFETKAPEVEVSSGDTDFASIKFQRENTLLTNAERYADSIRGEAELYVRQLQQEVDALNAEAEKRYEEAREIKETSEREAARKIEEAEQRVEEVRGQAYREGFEQGREEGMAERYREAGIFLENLESILLHVTKFRDHVNHYMEHDGIRLAVLIAKKILRQEMQINKKVVWKLLAGTLAQLRGQGTFRVWLNPEDFKFVTAARPSLEKFLEEDQVLSFRPRADIPAGNAMIETDREVIDLSFADQFRHMEELLSHTLAEREGSLLNRPTILDIPGWRPGQSAAAQSEAAPPEATPPETGAAEPGGTENEGAELEADGAEPPGEAEDPAAAPVPPAITDPPPGMAMDVATAAAPPDGAPPASEEEEENADG